MTRKFKVSVVVIAACVVIGACFKAGGAANKGVTVTTSLKGKTSIVGDIPCVFPLVGGKELRKVTERKPFTMPL